VLEKWNHADPTKCVFQFTAHHKQGPQIPEGIQYEVQNTLFVPEDFYALVLDFAARGESVGKLMQELREPRSGGSECIAWLAHTGVFPNVPGDQKDYLKEKFAAQRFRTGSIDTRAWLPPLTALVDTAVGPVTFVTGRKKWQVPGGFPALSHGGLTLMETFVPFMELSK
jgi:hypothetical protein